MFVCKICGSEVHVGQAYCNKCGADVVENYQTICSSCNARNAAGSKYCAKCGAMLPVLQKPVCAVCGHVNLPGTKFCVSCGAPIVPQPETHTAADVFEARKAKLRIDMMEKERMQAIDEEIAKKRAAINEEKEKVTKELEELRLKNQDEIDKQAQRLNRYHELLNELGAEDVEQLKKISESLKRYSVYYADPYSEIDEDEIIDETYVCPACGTINPINVVACSHCGRNKARASLLLAKDKIKQHPPVKRKKAVIPAPEADTHVDRLPDYEHFDEEAIAEQERIKAEEEAAKLKEEQEKKEQEEQKNDNFVEQPQNPYAGYPYVYPYMGYQGGDPSKFQMPPIVQPVAFVPYVTQDQPVLQYAPVSEKKDDNEQK